MRYLIEQTTRLEFDSPVREHQCEIRLVPRADAFQRVKDVRVTLKPEGSIQSYTDYFGNRVHQCDVIAPHDSLTIGFHCEVETLLENPFDFPILSAVQERRWLQDSLQQQPRLWDYVLHHSDLTPDGAHLSDSELGAPAADPTVRIMDAVIVARDWVTDNFTFTSESGGAVLPLTTVLKERTGGAPDLAHVLLTVLRRWGFPARYTNGYRDPDPDEKLDAVEPHAWVEALIPGAGWRGVDCTAGLVTNQTYIAVGSGRDARDVPFLRSSSNGGTTEVDPLVTIRLQRQQAQQ